MSQTTPCRTCGASLAPDQRYCLGCGTRVAPPRLDFLAESERAEAEARAAGGGAEAASGGADRAVVSGPVPSRLDKIGGPMGAAAVVLVALGIGFLIGQGRDDEAPAQRAPVVNIQSGDTAATTSELPAADGATDDAGGGDTPTTTGQPAADGTDAGAIR
ncbi:MAG TPA: hypothetical protein VLK58_26520 [Conexibacter sp.]|nr:hypothetical protein [Conexibacter sp.]